jgi:hypothetical protein
MVVDGTLIRFSTHDSHAEKSVRFLGIALYWIISAEMAQRPRSNPTYYGNRPFDAQPTRFSLLEACVHMMAV